MAETQARQEGQPHIEGYQTAVRETRLIRRQGKITQLIGELIEAYNPGTSVGSLCSIYNPDNGQKVMAEVIGFKGDKILLMALSQMPGIGPHCRVIPEDRPPTVRVGTA